MSESQESMEVTLHTEIESGASGFSVAGGGNEGIFVKKVLKESPASKLFSLREGDQLLSATIFFDNIKYEDALKILQYSEPYKVQFSLKRKLSEKEDLETIHSSTLSKKEKLSQGKETLEMSEKTITEEDKANLIVKQRVGRQKRPKKDRLSWPKFQSITGKKILRHRRSRSTSDAYEHAIPDVSPTSTDTEFLPEEIHTKVKKGSQKKLKFPSIGFKMYRSKPETEEKSKLEGKPWTEYEYGASGEPSEPIAVEDFTSFAQDDKTRYQHDVKKEIKEPKYELISQTTKCPEVEISIKKPKEKKHKSRGGTKPDSAIITSQITTSALEIKDTPTRQTSFPKIRKKKHKGSLEKIQNKMTMQKELQVEIKEGTGGIPYQMEQSAEIKDLPGDINISKGRLSLEIKAPKLEIQTPSAKIHMEGSDSNIEDNEATFKMPKFQKTKFGISLPKGKGAVEGEVIVPCVEAEMPAAELKGEVKVPSLEMGIKASGPQIEAPSVQVEVGEKGKIKMPEVKMSGVKVPKIKGPQVGVTLPKVEGDVSLPKVEAKLPEGEVSIKVPEAEGSIEGGGMKMHMPKFKMPSMGFSKPDLKGPKVNVDISAPKVDVALPSADLSISKPELKTGELAANISVSAPEFKMPAEQASLELKAPDFQIQAPSAEIALEGGDAKLEGVDGRFKMPKFHMPKFGISLPKGKGPVEGEVTVPCVEAEMPAAELKGEVKVPSLEMGIKASGPQIEAPSVQVEVGEKGKIKMPEVKMPSVKVPKIKGPQVGVTLPKVEGDVSLPKVEAKLPEGDVSVKVPEAEGSIEGGGMKMHMPKFKMPSMGFSKPDLKGPKVDVDVSAPKVDVALPSADLSISKPELKTGELAADISVSAPDVKIPTEQASLELKAPDFQIQAPSAEIALEGGEAKLEGVDGRFKMPKFHMPKFGISLPKGKGSVEGEVTVPCVEAEMPAAELKGEVKVPSLEMGIKASGPQIEAPSVQVEVGEKGKIKMPEVKMPSVKVPKIKGPQVGVTLPKVEGDVSLPKVEAKLPEGEVSVKVPEAEGSIEGGGMKMHMPKFKMPSMGFSKPDLKGPKVDVDVSAPKVDVTLPSADLSISKPELKTGELAADISVSAPDVKIPTEQASLELKAPEFQIQAPSAEIALEGGDAKLEGVDGKFKMPKFHMPKFGISLPKGKGSVEGEVTVPCVEAEMPAAELKGEVKVPSLEMGIKASGPQIEAPSVQVEMGEKGKIKMPEVKMPSVKVPKIKGPQVGVTLPKVEGDVSLPKVEAKLPEGEVSVKVPEVEGSIEGGGMKMHMPKFKMPSMGFSKPDLKGPKVDVDVSAPKVDVALPSADLSISKPELKTGELAADISVSAPKVKIPTEQASLELKAPDFQIQAPSAEIALEGGEAKLEGVDGKFKMPKFHMPKFGISLPKGKGAVEGEVTVPCAEAEIPTAVLKGEVTVPYVETQQKMSEAQIEFPSMQVNVGENVPEISGEAFSRDSDFNVAEIAVDGSKGKMKMPKFHIPKFGLSRTKEKMAESKVIVPKAYPDIPGLDTDVQILDIRIIEGHEIEADVSEQQIHTSPGKAQQKTDAHISSIDVPLPSVDVSVPKADVNIQAPCLDIKGLNMDASEKDTTEKESKFKMPKFKLPSFNWSPKKEASISGQADANLEDPSLTISTSERAPELTLTVEVDEEVVELDSHVSADKDAERSKFRRPQFSMPKLSLPKMKDHKADMSVSQLESDLKVSEQEDQGDRTLPIPEQEISGEGAKKGIKLPKVKLPSLELSKPEIKAPHVGMDVSLSESDAQLPASDVSLSKPGLKLGDIGVDVSIAASETKGSMAEDLVGPEIKMEGQSTEISLDGAEIKMEGVEGKFKKPKFQMPRFGISFSKGKVPDTEISLPSIEGEVPQLKTTTDIADIAVEASMLEAEYAVAGGEKIKIPPVSKAVTKTPALNVQLPSVGFPTPPPEKDFQSVEFISKEEKPEGDLKIEVLDTEEKDGHFKKPKFKLPSFGWSPKKEASLKTDIKEPLEDPKITLPEDTDAELTVVVPEDQGVQMDLDAEMSSKKGQVKRPHFAMPKISLLKPKLPKSQASLSKVEIDTTEEREGVLVQIPDIESSFTTGDEEATEISIKMPKGISKPQIKAPKTDVEAKVLTADVEVPATCHSFELKSSGREFEGKSDEVDVDTAGRKSDGFEIKMPKLQMPKFGTSVSEGEVPKGEVVTPAMKAEASKPRVTAERLDGEAPMLDVQVDTADVDVKGSSVKTKVSQMPAVEIKASDTSVCGPDKDVDVQEEHEIQTEGSQGWFKMPKFRMPSFGRSPSKGKKSDVEDPGADTKAPGADTQVEIKALETAVQALLVDTESCSGKDSLEGKVTCPPVPIPEGGVFIQKEKGSAVGPSVGQGSPLKPSGKIDVKLSAEGGKTYADVVKFGADEQVQKPPFSSPRDELCSSEISVPKVDATFPESGPALQLKTKPDDAPPVGCSVETKSLGVETVAAASAEITVDGTGRRIDIAGPKEEVTMLSRGAVAKTEVSSEMKSPKKDSQGKESGFKMPKFSMPSFGWSTPKSTGNVAEDLPHLEEPKAALVEIKMDASITDEDFEIIEFPVEDFEKDMSAEAEVKAEEKDRSSKTKASKFKLPKFGSLRTKSRGSEVDPPKGQAAGSLAKTEDGTLEIQIQKGDEPVDLKGTKISSVDKEFEDSELSFHIPKLKMPKFVHSMPSAEGQVLSLEGATDGKVVDAGGVSQLELRTKVLEEKADQTSYDIQKSKVRITTLSEPAVQRTKMESKMPSKESVFAETAVRIQRPMEFSTSFPKEQIDTMGSTVHKSVAKIAVLTEPDIQTTQLGIKLPSADPFTADASVHVQEPRGESRGIKIETTSVYGYDSKSQETFSTQIVRESEIPPSEIKTATYGFSLLKLKMQEPHLNIGVPVKCSSTEDMSETFENKDCQPEVSIEGSGIATQKTVSIGFKVPDKGQVIAGGFPEGASSTTTSTKLKPFAADVQSSSEFADSCSDMQPKEISVSAVSKDNEEMKTSKLGEEPAEQKEDSDNSSSSGRFKLWFPTIGFSSSVDDASDSKAEDQTLFPEEMQPKDPTATDSDPSKQTGWFRFPKLGFSSPAKKVDKKEETAPKKTKTQGEESPTEKTEMFFDAQETLPPKEMVAETEETSGAAIVSSSARTELILLEKEKAASQACQIIPEEPPK
ncbi:protein AHNAK2-like isoform X2 [Sphaerodactylus townsendi]|nr:protein AHNAK2-like isoform X2 [Sphaerodactylus townsendi]